MLKTPYKKTILEMYKKSLKQYYIRKEDRDFEIGVQYTIEKIVEQITPEYNKYLEEEAEKAFKKWGMK